MPSLHLFAETSPFLIPVMESLTVTFFPLPKGQFKILQWARRLGAEKASGSGPISPNSQCAQGGEKETSTDEERAEGPGENLYAAGPSLMSGSSTSWGSLLEGCETPVCF